MESWDCRAVGTWELRRRNWRIAGRSVCLRVLGTGLLVGLLMAMIASLAMAAVPAGDLPTKVGPNGQTVLPAGLPESELESSNFERIPGQYIVVFKDSVDHPGNVATAQAGDQGGALGFVYHSAIKGYSVAGLSKADVEALRRNPVVKYVSPDGKMEGTTQTTPTGVSRVFATENEYLDIDGIDDARVSVDVAMIDSGTDDTHPDLNVVGKTNCVPLDEESAGGSCIDGSDVEGEHPHGTHTGGIVGAIDNGEGVVGVAPGARLWSVRVLSKEKWGYWSWLIAGVDWVAAHASEVEVANMSVAGYGPVPALQEAISEAVDKGVVFAVAAGNEAVNTAEIVPPSYPDVIGVSGLADFDGKPGGTGASCGGYGPDDGMYPWSDWGSTVDITAPAVCIFSSVPGGYEKASGTSMAAPHVAGAAAVLASKANPNTRKDVEAIRQELIDSGSLAWTDTSEDGKVEPVLYIGGKPLTATEVATGGWSSTDGSSVTLYGGMNVRGLETTYKFEYGTTTEYGQSAPTTAKTVSTGTKYTNVSEVIGSGIKPGQTYHYRITATNSSGTFYGKDRTFTVSRWKVELPASGPSNPETDWLDDVACPAPGTCFAAGSYINSEVGKHAAAYRLENGEWKFESLPVPSGGYGSTATSVSCTSTTACTVVGDFTNSEDKIAPFVARWNGTSWQNQTVPAPYIGAPYTRFVDVSCASSTECMGVGIYWTEEDTYASYAARWSGGSWVIALPPDPVNTTKSLLEGVSCPSTSMCKAVGWHTISGSETSRPLIVSWNGSSWALNSTARTIGWLAGVTCVSTELCYAVGGSWASEVPIEKWNGSAWSNPSAEQPEGGYLEDVSCASSTQCVAMGTTWLGPVRTRRATWSEKWNGTDWKIDATPRNAEAIGEFRGVSCIGLWGCGAVGYAEETRRTPVIVRREGVVTGEPTNISGGKATMSGSVNPGGLSTTYQFEYGTTTSYGGKLPASSESVGSGNDPVDVSQELTELQPETVYHYRLTATNTNGSQYGKDRTFRSAAPAHQLQFSFGTTGSGKLNYPMGIATDNSGNVWVADRDNNRIVKFNSKGEYLLSSGTLGAGNGQFNKPVDIAVTSSGDVWVTDSENDRVQRLNSKGEYQQQFGSSGLGNGQFAEPWGIAVDGAGNVWVSDHSHYRIQEFSSAGSFIRSVGSGGGSGALEFKWPSGVAMDPEGDIWVADMGNNRVQQFSSTGQYLSQFGVEGMANGQLDEPLVIDTKPSGDILVAERGTDRVQQFSQAGEYIGKFNLVGNPEAAGIATTGGTVYVSNTRENRLEKWQQAIPEPITQAASEVGQTTASLAGTVNPHGVATTYRFEYGKTTAYGTKIPVPNESAGSGNEAAQKTQAISGLQENATYHFRLVASNVNGTVYGKDESLKTKTGTGSQLGSMAVTEPFNGSSSSLANFSANWAALGWVSGTPAKGEDTTSGWRPAAAYPTVNGAYYNSTVADIGSGIAAVATMAVNPGNTSRYFSIWLDMGTPSSTRGGYELRFTNVATNSYSVTLSKWQSGSQTVLASQASYSFVNGHSIAVVDQGGTISAWTNTGSGFSQLLSASDSTFSSGKSAIEGSGNITRLNNFKVGSL
jgi:subtilisin family serine protease/sugar lactone lactonase YvrE